jgi:hypothetical protein
MDMECTRVSGVERQRAIGTLVCAFAADPFVRWIYPQAGQYLTHFPEALQAFGGAAFGHGSVTSRRSLCGCRRESNQAATPRSPYSRRPSTLGSSMTC